MPNLLQNIEISSDVPVGAGLSSSAALECSVAVAVDEALGLDRSREQLVEACVRAETETVGAPTGGLDQTIAIYGQAENALLIDFATGDREHVPFAPGAHGLGVLVIDTKVSHELTDGGYGSRRDQAWEAAKLLGIEFLAQARPEDLDDLAEPMLSRARHVVSEVLRVDAFVEALRADDWDSVGPLLVASHVSLRDDYEVSCEELDVTVDVAREAGAVGARMTGGGFGGSVIALVPLERVDAVQAAVVTAFVARGWGRPEFFVAEPGAGARLE
jgi:galactokinase